MPVCGLGHPDGGEGYPARRMAARGIWQDLQPSLRNSSRIRSASRCAPTSRSLRIAAEPTQPRLRDGFFGNHRGPDGFRGRRRGGTLFHKACCVDRSRGILPHLQEVAFVGATEAARLEGRHLLRSTPAAHQRHTRQEGRRNPSTGVELLPADRRKENHGPNLTGGMRRLCQSTSAEHHRQSANSPTSGKVTP